MHVTKGPGFSFLFPPSVHLLLDSPSLAASSWRTHPGKTAGRSRGHPYRAFETAVGQAQLSQKGRLWIPVGHGSGRRRMEEEEKNSPKTTLEDEHRNTALRRSHQPCLFFRNFYEWMSAYCQLSPPYHKQLHHRQVTTASVASPVEESRASPGGWGRWERWHPGGGRTARTGEQVELIRGDIEMSFSQTGTAPAIACFLRSTSTPVDPKGKGCFQLPVPLFPRRFFGFPVSKQRR